MAVRDVKIRIIGDPKSAKDAFDSTDRKAGSFFESVSTKAVAFGTALGDAISAGAQAAFDQISAGISGAFDMEDAAGRMEASLGTTATRAGELGEVAGNVYRDAWGSSLDEVGLAVASLESSFEGLTAPQLEELTGQAIAFADVFNTDVDSAIRSADQLVNQGLAPNAEAAFDLLTTGMQELPVSVRDELLEATHEYGQFFDALGLSGEEAIGGLVNAGEDGIYGIDKFGDALKELTIRSTDMSATSVAAYESAGLSAEDMSARFLAGGETANGAFNDLIDGLLAIEDPVEQANAAIGLFGTPLEDLGVGEIPDFLEGLSDMDAGMEDVAGSAQEMADSFGNTTRNKIESFRRKVMGKLSEGIAFVIEKFEEVWPAIQEGFGKAVEWMKRNLLPMWEDFTEDVMPEIIDGLEAVGDAFSDAFEWIMNNKGIVIGAITGIGTAITIHMIPKFIAWAAAAWAAASAQIAAYAPMILLTVALAAIGAAIVYAYQNFEGFRNVVDGVARFLRDTVWPIIQQVFGFIVEAAKGIVEWFQENWDTISEVVSTVFSRIKEIFDGAIAVWGGIFTTIKNLVTGEWGAAWDALKETIRLAWEYVKLIVQAAVDVLKLIIPAAWNVIKFGAQVAWDGIKALINVAWEGIKFIAQAAVNWLKETIMTAWDRIKATAGVVWALLKNVIFQAWEGIKLVAKAAVDWVKTKVGEAWEGIKSAASTAWNGIKSTISGVWDGIKETARTGIAAIVLHVASLPGKLLALIGDISAAGLSIGKAIIDGISAGVSGVAGFFGDIGSAVVTAVKQAVNSVIDSINNALEFTISGPGFLPDITFNAPDIPRLHGGGWATGISMGNDEMLAILQSGEYVSSREQVAAGEGPFGGGDALQVIIEQLTVGSRDDLPAVRSMLEDLVFRVNTASG